MTVTTDITELFEKDQPKEKIVFEQSVSLKSGGLSQSIYQPDAWHRVILLRRDAVDGKDLMLAFDEGESYLKCKTSWCLYLGKWNDGVA